MVTADRVPVCTMTAADPTVFEVQYQRANAKNSGLSFECVHKIGCEPTRGSFQQKVKAGESLLLTTHHFPSLVKIRCTHAADFNCFSWGRTFAPQPNPGSISGKGCRCHAVSACLFLMCLSALLSQDTNDTPRAVHQSRSLNSEFSVC